jgi:hypothetical protein
MQRVQHVACNTRPPRGGGRRRVANPAPSEWMRLARRPRSRHRQGRSGVSRSVAMRLTGHKTEAVYRRYAIVAENDLREAGTKLAAALRTSPQTGSLGDNPGDNSVTARKR